MVDTHAHLAAAASFPPESVAGVLERAWAAGLEAIVVPAGSPDEFDAVAELARLPRVFGLLGYHPDTAVRCTPDDVDQLRPLLAQPGIVGVGEAGIDLYWSDSVLVRSRQEVLCRAQLELARELDLPISLHLRDQAGRGDAAELLLRLLRSTPARAVIHSCTAPVSVVRELLAAGCMISFSGITTFPRADDVRAACAAVPDERLLVETDAPFLAPVPYRGRTNEPAFVRETARIVATARGADDTSTWARVGENAKRFFTLNSRLPSP